MPNLLADQLSGASVVLPLPNEEFSKEGIQGLLLIAILLASAGILLLQGGQEPLQHPNRPLGCICLLRRRRKDGRVLAPVGAELCQAS